MAQLAEGSPVGGLVAVVEQLVQDVAEDAEVYQQAFPDSSPVSLPAISARWALQLKKLLLHRYIRLSPGLVCIVILTRIILIITFGIVCIITRVFKPEGSVVCSSFIWQPSRLAYPTFLRRS